MRILMIHGVRRSACGIRLRKSRDRFSHSKSPSFGPSKGDALAFLFVAGGSFSDAALGGLALGGDGVLADWGDGFWAGFGDED